MDTNKYKQLYIAANRCYSRGFQRGNGGNISCRGNINGQMIVKTSGGSLGDCSEEGKGFVVTDFEGKVIRPLNVKPTREVFLHGLLYKLLPEIGGIVHTHSPYAVAWSYQEKSLPAVTLHMQLKYGCDIPVVNIDTPVVEAKDADKIVDLFKKNPKLPGFILKGHGIVAVGRNVIEAEHVAELIEETAIVYQLKLITEGITNINAIYNMMKLNEKK